MIVSRKEYEFTSPAAKNFPVGEKDREVIALFATPLL